MGLAERYPVRYTVEDWKHWQGDWELVEGIPYAMASPRPINQVVLVVISHLFYVALRECKRCMVAVELDWYISYDTVIRPDLIVFCGETPQKLEEPPELVLEIVSPSSRDIDEGLKFELCEREGVKYFVLVYPEEKSLKVFELVGGKYKEKRGKRFNFGDCEVELNLEEAFYGLG